NLRVLNNVPLEMALRLRSENRLESLRLFLRKIWKACRDSDEFSERNAVALSAELNDEIAKARDEWSKIDQELLKWVAPMVGAELVSAAALNMVPSGVAAVVTAGAGLIHSRL